MTGSRAGNAASAARLVLGLPRFLRRRPSLTEARAIVRRRLERRPQTFLDVARCAIFARPGSPYRRLLRIAGCELGDLEGLVAREGLDGALRTLFRAGVYLGSDEAKGRRPVVRGGETFEVLPGELQNPLLATHFWMHTGGSSGAATTISIDLATIRDRAVDRQILLEIRGATGATYVEWGMPGSQTVFTVLEHACAGLPVRHWLLKIDPGSPELHPAYRWSLRMVRWGSVLALRPLARPEFVPPDQSLAVARRIAAALRAGEVVWYNGTVSSGVSVAIAAMEAGLDLRGLRFTVASEPMTEARLATMRRSGAEARVAFGTTEVSRIGYGCLRADAVNDVHVLGDLNAVIQPGPDGPAAGLPEDALLLTSVSPTAPTLSLNLSLGDRARLDERDCGCPYPREGWTARLCDISSFEKLTAAGMTFVGSDVMRILGTDLPARFGGGPLDYQLVEEERKDGLPRVVLVVAPSVGAVDPAAVVDFFLDRLGAGSGANRVMAMTWRESRIVQVERRPPHMTSTAKILPVHRR